jgi:hypothetical protein
MDVKSELLVEQDGERSSLDQVAITSRMFAHKSREIRLRYRSCCNASESYPSQDTDALPTAFVVNFLTSS